MWRPGECAYGKTVWSWPSLLWSSSSRRCQRAQPGGRHRQFAKAREARRNSAPGRARHKPSTPCAGKAERSASPVCCCAVLPACAFRAADRGCEVSTRPSLRPLAQEGGEMKQSSGETRRENAKVCLRFNMWAERATRLPPPPSLRAQRSNPESIRGGRLDCFAALAMTIWRERAPPSRPPLSSDTSSPDSTS